MIGILVENADYKFKLVLLEEGMVDPIFKALGYQHYNPSIVKNALISLEALVRDNEEDEYDQVVP